MADIMIPPDQDLHVVLMRPDGARLLHMPLNAGAEHRRALYRLCISAETRRRDW